MTEANAATAEDRAVRAVREYEGWTITAYEQIRVPPFQPFVAVARREHNGTIFSFNVEAHSVKEAIERARKRIHSTPPQNFGLPPKGNHE